MPYRMDGDGTSPAARETPKKTWRIAVERGRPHFLSFTKATGLLPLAVFVVGAFAVVVGLYELIPLVLQPARVTTLCAWGNCGTYPADQEWITEATYVGFSVIGATLLGFALRFYWRLNYR